jgi:hypothetical protein
MIKDVWEYFEVLSCFVPWLIMAHTETVIAKGSGEAFTDTCGNEKRFAQIVEA